jgi:dihydroflavonol-4-reductase
VKILVTGGNGFIGSVVVRMLREKGLDVRCLVRRTSRLDRIGSLGCEFAYGDLLDSSSLEAAAMGCNAAIHLAGLSSWKLISSPQMRDIVVGGTRNVLNAAAAAKLERVVYVSSTVAVAGSQEPSVYDESTPQTLPLDKYIYAGAKHDAEVLCRQYCDRMSVVIVNPGEVYGPNDVDLITADNLIDFAKSNPVLVCKGGTSVGHVDDVAAGMVAALERGRSGERYILSGENVTIRRLAELTNQILSLKKTILTFPTPIVEGIAWSGRTFGIPLPFNPNMIPYATLYWFTDSGKAGLELGVRFRDAVSTLKPALEWCQSAGHIPKSKVSA